MPNFKRIGGGPWKNSQKSVDLIWNDPKAFSRLVGVMTLLDQNHGKSTKCQLHYKVGILDLIIQLAIYFVTYNYYREDFPLTVVIQIWFCLL